MARERAGGAGADERSVDGLKTVILARFRTFMLT
jgi:hypothetical protein